MNEIEARRIEAVLLETPCKDWRTLQAVVLDWNDGPREGLCALSEPRCEFYFELHTEKHDAANLDDRLYLVSLLKMGSVERLVKALGPGVKHSHPVWTPTWRFDTPRSRIAAEKILDSILATRRPTGLIIRTRDLRKFTDCLSVSRDIKKFLSWFEYKGFSA